METERISAASCALGMLAYPAVMSLFPASDAAGADRAGRGPVPVLTAPQRRVIELAYFAGLTQTEIAELTATPLGTVKTRVRLAMNKLRVALKDARPHAAARREDREA